MGFVVIVAIVLAVLWGLKDPFVGLLALVAVNLIQPGELYPMLAPLHLEKVVAIAVLLSFLAHHQRFKFPAIIKSGMYFYAAVILSIPLSIWASNAFSNAVDIGKTMIYMLLIAALVDSRKRFYLFLLTFVLLMGYFSVTAMVNYYAGHYAHAEGFDRIVGLTSDSDTTDGLALTMATAIPLVLLLAGKGAAKWVRLSACAILGCCLWTMLLTGSRVTMLGFLVAVVAYALTAKRKIVATLALVLVGLSLWAVLPQQYQHRYTKESTTEYLNQDDSYTQRLRIWRSGWQMFLDHPLTGVGAGDFNMADGSIYWLHHWMDAHNLFFKVIAELGLIGLVAFATFVTVLVRANLALARAMKKMAGLPAYMRQYPRVANLIVLMLLVTGYGAHDLYRSTWYFLAGTTAALGFALKDMETAASDASALVPDVEPRELIA